MFHDADSRLATLRNHSNLHTFRPALRAGHRVPGERLIQRLVELPRLPHCLADLPQQRCVVRLRYFSIDDLFKLDPPGHTEETTTHHTSSGPLQCPRSLSHVFRRDADLGGDLLDAAE